MRDKLGREIKDYDLVLGMIVSRDSDGMRFGVVYANQVYWENGVKSVPRNIYLIDNPCEKEIEIKNKILEIVEKASSIRDNNKNIKHLSAKDYIVGHIYETSNGEKFAYLGKGHVAIQEKDWWGKILNKELDGFIYFRISGFSDIKSIKSANFKENQSLSVSFTGTKSRKKFVKDTGEKIDIIDKYCVIHSEWETVGNINTNKMYEKAVIELYE